MNTTRSEALNRKLDTFKTPYALSSTKYGSSVHTKRHPQEKVFWGGGVNIDTYKRKGKDNR
jgi:hypothetical protein